MTVAPTQSLAPPPADTPLALYAQGLADVTDSEGVDPLWVLRYEDGRAVPLRLRRWVTDTVPGDAGLISRCTGSTLDVGCGPGRLAAAISNRALPVLGLDISAAAVRLARGRGAIVLEQSVFDQVPGEGRWRHVLLADGNLGIGGDPATLLRRCAQLLTDDGDILAEIDAPGTGSRICRVRIEADDGRASQHFPWAHVAADHIEAVADRAGLRLAEIWMEAGRWFAALAHR